MCIRNAKDDLLFIFLWNTQIYYCYVFAFVFQFTSDFQISRNVHIFLWKLFSCSDYLSTNATNNGNMLHIYHKVISLEQSWRQLTYFTVKINLNFIWSTKYIWEAIRISKKKPSGAETKTIKRNTETFELCFVIRNKFVTTDFCCFSWVLWSRLF